VTGVRAKKRLGQHFLEPQWADKLVAAIGPRAEDRFLEIGPGPGALTLRLAPMVAHLTAVEIDRGMAARLAPGLPANASLVHADFLDFDLSSLGPGPLRVAGNLPYNVSSPILFKLLDASASGTQPKGAAPSEGGRAPVLVDATLMVQREVADRMTAPPGGREYGVLAILVRLCADARRILALPPGAFRPAPKVHSAVVSLRFRPPPVELSDAGLFVAMVRSMFTQRRKTLANALRPFADARGAKATEALAGSGIDPRRRPETLQLDELARLADAFAARSRRAVL
jgi:16S rRNA (adenine1518-N6/adenine1519-N6)-dimethyltransferase